MWLILSRETQIHKKTEVQTRRTQAGNQNTGSEIMRRSTEPPGTKQCTRLSDSEADLNSQETNQGQVKLFGTISRQGKHTDRQEVMQHGTWG